MTYLLVNDKKGHSVCCIVTHFCPMTRQVSVHKAGHRKFGKFGKRTKLPLAETTDEREHFYALLLFLSFLKSFFPFFFFLCQPLEEVQDGGLVQMWDYLRHATLHCLAEGSNFRPRGIRWVVVFPSTTSFSLSLLLRDERSLRIRNHKARKRNLIRASDQILARYCAFIIYCSEWFYIESILWKHNRLKKLNYSNE